VLSLGTLKPAFADGDPASDIMAWRERVPPSELVLKLAPVQPTFRSCDKASFTIAITNHSHELVTFDLGNVDFYGLEIRDSKGHRVVPTGVGGIVDSSIFFVSVAAGDTRDLGGISLTEPSPPFSSADCPRGTYAAVLHLRAGRGYVVTSNSATFAIP
jgi:hypothetical protein